MEIKNFKEILKSYLKEKGVSPQELSQETGIVYHYIQAFLEGNFEKLPSLPYVRGYLQKIADYLEIDFEELWQQYQKEAPIKKSGEEDKMPTNRFAPQPLNKKNIAIVVLILIILSLVIPRLAKFLGSPQITIISPNKDNLVVSQQNFLLKGQVDNPQDKVLINNEEVFVLPDGSFEKEVFLTEKINLFQFKVKRFLGKEITLERTVIYEPQASPTN
ncbi:MAG: hypothetical protein KatS3mg098_074 [Candidatus Parcubacteria bacterium]|nr:helix-turn-helix domain-containing protein [Patescibacteria group bacterium]BCX15845.1 MAG: hypothetical protein KatS3mg098_074 [Candidatus Parcubacteria bacterium]